MLAFWGLVMPIEWYSERFTQEEAEARVGRTVRATVAFSRVPEGTSGQVVRVDRVGSEMEPAAYDVVVQWDLPVPSPSADVVIPARDTSKADDI